MAPALLLVLIIVYLFQHLPVPAKVKEWFNIVVIVIMTLLLVGLLLGHPILRIG